MSPVFAALRELSSAEDILGYFGISYDARIVNVNRLHILKRFQQYLRQAGQLDGMDNTVARSTARELLEKAYGDFVNSTAVEQKVFPVFHPGKTQRISVDSLRGSFRAA